MTTPERRGLRAKDTDRLATVDRLEAALRDGQLTPVEADERIAEAHEAVTVGKLEDLLGDLQDIPVMEGVPARSRRRARIAGAVAAVVVAGGATYALSFGDGDHGAKESDTIQRDPKPAEAAPEATGPRSEPDEEPPPAPVEYSFTARGMRNFIRLYTDEFKKPPKAVVFGFTSTGVVLYLRNGNAGKVHKWDLYEGRFVDRGPGDSVRQLDASRSLIDLRKLDIEEAFAHVRTVRKQGRTSLADFHIVGLTILRLDGEPRVVATAANRQRTQCYQIFSTLAGRVVDKGTTNCAVG